MRTPVPIVSGVVLLALLAPGVTEAADVVQDRTLTNAAEANFLSHFGCTDESVGVSVTEKRTNKNDAAPEATIQVFGAFIDYCEFGTSTFFFGTTTVASGEFVQHGVDDATLHKTFDVGGHEISISLVWTGTGVVGGEDEKINEKTGTTHEIRKWDVDSRGALMTGTFVVDGLNRIQDDTFVNAQLDVINLNAKTITK